MPSDSKKRSKSTTLYSWVRQIHYYTALPLAVILLFLVITGLISLQDKVNPKANPPKEITTSCDIPSSIPMQKESVGRYLQDIFPGKCDYETADEDDSTFTINIESVWRYHTIMVNKETRKCTVKIEVYPTSQGFVDLHNGKQASRPQLILFQIIGIVIVIMILTGVSLAILRKSTKQRLIAMVLLALGCVLLTVLAVNR